jgi:hypothetical protein
MAGCSFRVLAAEKNLLVTTYEMPNGKIEQYLRLGTVAEAEAGSGGLNRPDDK